MCLKWNVLFLRNTNIATTNKYIPQKPQASPNFHVISDFYIDLGLPEGHGWTRGQIGPSAWWWGISSTKGIWEIKFHINISLQHSLTLTFGGRDQQPQGSSKGTSPCGRRSWGRDRSHSDLLQQTWDCPGQGNKSRYTVLRYLGPHQQRRGRVPWWITCRGDRWENFLRATKNIESTRSINWKVYRT